MSPTNEAEIMLMPKIAEYRHTTRTTPEGLTEYESIIPNGNTRDSFQKLLDITVVYEKAKEEAKTADKPVIDLENIQVADFSHITYINFPSTGDPAQDYAIDLGLKYERSCFEGNVISGDAMLYELNKQQDLTGMTPAEKYKAVYEKYQKCYGENFLYAEAANYASQSVNVDHYRRTISNFENEIKAVCGDDCNMTKLRKNALYPDMSETEIQNAIVEKFDLSDGMTLTELYQMTYELKICGVGKGLHNLMKFTPLAEQSQIWYQNGVQHKNIPYQNFYNAYDKAMHSNVTTDYMQHVKKAGENLYPGNSDLMGEWEFFNSLVKKANGISSGKSLMDQYNGINGIKL